MTEDPLSGIKERVYGCDFSAVADSESKEVRTFVSLFPIECDLSWFAARVLICSNVFSSSPYPAFVFQKKYYVEPEYYHQEKPKNYHNYDHYEHHGSDDWWHGDHGSDDWYGGKGGKSGHWYSGKGGKSGGYSDDWYGGKVGKSGSYSDDWYGGKVGKSGSYRDDYGLSSKGGKSGHYVGHLDHNYKLCKSDARLRRFHELD